jgi:hypothetical protein
MKKKFTISVAVFLVIVIAVLWLFWGADTWDVQISGVTGDGRNIQYRIETVYTDTADIPPIGTDRAFLMWSLKKNS